MRGGGGLRTGSARILAAESADQSEDRLLIHRQACRCVLSLPLQGAPTAVERGVHDKTGQLLNRIGNLAAEQNLTGRQAFQGRDGGCGGRILERVDSDRSGYPRTRGFLQPFERPLQAASGQKGRLRIDEPGRQDDALRRIWSASRGGDDVDREGRGRRLWSP